MIILKNKVGFSSIIMDVRWVKQIFLKNVLFKSLWGQKKTIEGSKFQIIVGRKSAQSRNISIFGQESRNVSMWGQLNKFSNFENCRSRK